MIEALDCPNLRIEGPGHEPVVYDLVLPEILIGRARACGIVLKDPLVAEIHLYLRFREGSYEVQAAEPHCDLRVNGRTCSSSRLSHWDRISIGASELVFHWKAPKALPRTRATTARPYEQLLSFSQRLLGNYDIREILQELTDCAVDMTAADKGFLVFLEEQGPRIRIARNFRRDTLGDAVAQMSDSIVRTVLETQEPLFLANVHDHPEFAAAPSARKLGLDSVLCLPLTDRGQVLGLIYVGKHSGERRFSTSLFEPMQILAAEGALLVRNALLIKDLQFDLARLSPSSQNPRLGELVGASDSMQEVFRQVLRYASGEMPVLITGEPSTGKALVAREVYRRSPRSRGQWMTLDASAPWRQLRLLVQVICAGLEMARVPEAGLHPRIPPGSTLLVEEIHKLPMQLQQGLVRYLEAYAGPPEQARPAVPVRLIATTHVDLAERVAEGRFHRPLYERLSAAWIHLAPLREREDDVLLLAQHFLERYTREGRSSPARGFSPAAREAMRAYGWPGNIGELELRIQHAVMNAKRILLDPEALHLGPHTARSAPATQPLAEARRNFERQYIREVLARHDGNRQRTALALGINRATLHRYLSGMGS
jgi:DNA-binding NtrC family response regulator